MTLGDVKRLCVLFSVRKFLKIRSRVAKTKPLESKLSHETVININNTTGYKYLDVRIDSLLPRGGGTSISM